MNKDFSRNTAYISEKKIKEREYWINKLSGDLVKVCFPMDKRKKNGNTGKSVFETVKFQLGGEIFTRLMKLRNQSDHILHMILAAAAVILLHKYSWEKHRDIIVGAPIYKQDIQGEFINTVLPLRVPLPGSVTFKELLLQVRQTIMEAVENQNFPLESLLYYLNIPFSKDGDFPLFDVVILLENIHEKAYLENIHFNMTFSFSREADSINGVLEFKVPPYEKRKVKRIREHFVHVLGQCLDNIDASIDRVELLSKEEQEKLLFEFNSAPQYFAEEQTLGMLFENQVEKTPDQVALIGEIPIPKSQISNNEAPPGHLSYRELNEKSNQLAHFLRKKGVRPDTLVAIMAERDIDTIISITGVLKAGGGYLPIDPETPMIRNTFILEESGAAPVLSKNISLDKNSTLSKESKSNPHHVNRSTDLAYTIFTSGSTGKPKGVVIQHRNVHYLVQALKERIYKHYRPEGYLKVSMVSPFIFDASIKQIFGALMQGHGLYVVKESVRVDVVRLFEFYREHCIDIADGTPAHIGMLIEAMKGSTYPYFTGNFLIGGEPLTREVIENFFSGFITADGTPKITNVYGPTECSVDSTAFEVSLDNIDRSADIPIGAPMPNCRVYILDSELNLLPVGVPGELCISGAGVGRGYLNDPQLTAEKFCLRRPGGLFSRKPPLAAGGNIYKTGDLARWLPCGNIVFIGRKDQQVKVRGFRIEPGEIEKRLVQHKRIKEAVVIIKGKTGNDKYLCAYVVPGQSKPGEAPDSHELKEYLSRELPEYMIPTRFVQIEKIPLTPNGKINRQALPEPGIGGSGGYIAPGDSLEERLVELFAGVLGIKKDKVSIEDNFFESGGHSLKATILLARMHKALDIKIPLAELFRYPTVRELSGYIKNVTRQQFVSIPKAKIQPYYPLTSAVKRLYFEHKNNH